MTSDRIKNWPAKERPRERLISEGPQRLTDAELLAIVLRVGRGTFKKDVSGESATALAKRLLTEFNGLRGLDRAHIEELLKTSGLSTAKVAQIKAAFELGKRVVAKKLTALSVQSASEVAAHFRPRFTNARQETVNALLLDGQNHPLGEVLISEGIPTQSTIYIRRIMEEALRASAAAIVLIHNHPSGSPEPSAGDDETTRDVLKACSLLNMLFLDHVIVGERDHYSYADSGRFDELRDLEGIK